MFTSDGFEIEWRYSDAPTTSLTQTQLLSLLEGDACSRALAHASLPLGAFYTLYRGSDSNEKIGGRFRRVGLRIKSFRVERYARNVGIRKLETILRQKDRASIVRALLQASAPT